MRLKLLDIPRRQRARAQHHPPAHLERAVQLRDLLRGRRGAGVEPVHRVHHHRDGQCAGADARDDLVDFVGVDAQPVKRAGPGEPCVGLRSEVIRVAAAGEVAG